VVKLCGGVARKSNGPGIIMKKSIILAVLVLLLSMCLMVACGTKEGTTENVNSAADSTVAEADNDDKEEIVAEVKEENKDSDKAVDSDKADEENDGSAEVDSSNTDDSSADGNKADADAESKEANDGIDWDDIKALTEPVVMYAQRSANIRKGPGTTYNKVGELEVNDEVKVIGENSKKDWKEIEYKDGVAFIYSNLVNTDKVDLEAIKAAEEAAAQAAAEAASQDASAGGQQAPPQQATTQKAVSSAGTLFIGDSRTCQMRAATGGGGCGWICEYCTTFDWFRDTAIPQADPLIGNGTKVVICMGVNDPGSIYNYANLVNEKAAEWVARGARVYYVSINPVDHPYEDKIPNIDSFNSQMPGLLANVRWIDTASVVKQGGFVLEDGIHYDAAGNISIYNMIVRSLK